MCAMKDALDRQASTLETLNSRVQKLEHFIRSLAEAETPSTTTSLRQLSEKLDIVLNEIEFVRRRTNTYLGHGTAIGHLADQTPIFLDPTNSGPAANVLDGGLYEQDNVDLLMSFVKPNSIFLDIGANIGIFSLQIARRLTEDGRVYSFEPQQNLTDHLRKSAFLNGFGSLNGDGRITSHALGVSDQNAELSFEIPRGHLGGGRVVADREGAAISVVRLDDFLSNDFRCDLVKIDIEGHELFALRGMRRIIERSGNIKILFEKMGQIKATKTRSKLCSARCNLTSMREIGSGAQLVPLAPGQLRSWDGNVFVAKSNDPELRELNRRRFRIYPVQLGLQAASLEGGNVKSKALIGSHFHGPYWFLPRGQYNFNLIGDLRGALDITIASRFGFPLNNIPFDGNSDTSRFFTIERDAVLFECIGRCGSLKAQLALRSIEISAV